MAGWLIPSSTFSFSHLALSLFIITRISSFSSCITFTSSCHVVSRIWRRNRDVIVVPSRHPRLQRHDYRRFLSLIRTVEGKKEHEEHWHATLVFQVVSAGSFCYSPIGIVPCSSWLTEKRLFMDYLLWYSIPICTLNLCDRWEIDFLTRFSMCKLWEESSIRLVTTPHCCLIRTMLQLESRGFRTNGIINVRLDEQEEIHNE